MLTKNIFDFNNVLVQVEININKCGYTLDQGPIIDFWLNKLLITAY